MSQADPWPRWLVVLLTVAVMLLLYGVGAVAWALR